MRFMIIRKADDETEAGAEASEELFAAMVRYNEELAKAGAMVGGDGLQPSSKGARVRFSGGRKTVIDGPFAEAKELIAGYTLIDVASKDEAIAWARKWPPLDGNGEVVLELRRVFEAEDFGAEFTPELREREDRLRADIAATEATETTTRFMIILKSDERTEAGAMPSGEDLAAMSRYNEELAAAGVLLAGEGLQPSSQGARVAFSGGRPTVTDGPFTEARELVAGFWVIQAKSRDEAIEWVKRVPLGADADTEIELRQVYEAEDFGEQFGLELREQEERLRAQLAERSR